MSTTRIYRFHQYIDREFQGLESLPDALNYIASNQAAGKIVVTV